MTNLITNTKILWALFAAVVVLAFGFSVWTPAVGGTILDNISSVDQLQELLASMSDEQKASHFWMTISLDMLFPLAYGGLFAGLALKHGGKFGLWLAIPAILAVPADLLENITQLIILSGNDGLLGVKAVISSAKLILLPIAALIAIGSLIYAGGRKILKK